MQSAAVRETAPPSAAVVQCPECGDSHVMNKGSLPKCRKFAGQTLNKPFAGGSLFSCKACGLSFRFPSLSTTEYQALYDGSYNHFWSSENLRYDQRLISDEIHRLLPEGGKVLDVGCYDGALLASLGPQVGKFGIEPSSAATEVARQASVEIVGNTISDLKSMDNTFDLICGINVIEHVHNPLDMLSQMTERVRPGGYVLVSTGDASSTAWRVLGPSYWYSANPEHISFISPSWCEQAAKKMDLQLVRVFRFRYESLPLFRQAMFWAELALKTSISAFEKTVISAVSANARRLGPRVGLGRQGMFKDHFYAVFRRR